MEVKCPKCQADVTVSSREETAFCRECGAGLNIEMDAEGFALVSAGTDVAKDTRRPGKPAFGDDPILADHDRWRQGAMFAIVFGLAFLAGVILSIVSDYTSYGIGFFKSGVNRLFVICALFVSLLCIGGGSFLFFTVNRETKKYLRAIGEEDETPEP